MAAGDSSRSASGIERAEIQSEVDAHLKTLRDLGPEYTDDVANAFMDRIDHLIDARVQQAVGNRRIATVNRHAEQRKTLAMILGLSIPLLAIAGGIGGMVGLIVVAGCFSLLAIIVMTHNP